MVSLPLGTSLYFFVTNILLDFAERLSSHVVNNLNEFLVHKCLTYTDTGTKILYA